MTNKDNGLFSKICERLYNTTFAIYNIYIKHRLVL